jgi:hypothetical protein
VAVLVAVGFQLFVLFASVMACAAMRSMSTPIEDFYRVSGRQQLEGGERIGKDIHAKVVTR